MVGRANSHSYVCSATMVSESLCSIVNKISIKIDYQSDVTKPLSRR